MYIIRQFHCTTRIIVRQFLILRKFFEKGEKFDGRQKTAYNERGDEYDTRMVLLH